MKKCDSDADPLERARGAHKSTPATDSKYSSVVCLSRPEIGETQIERRVFGARGRVVLESTVSIEAEAALFLQHSPPAEATMSKDVVQLCSVSFDASGSPRRNAFMRANVFPM